MNTCNDIELLLADAATSSLSSGEAAMVEEHLRTCPSCARTFQEMSQLLERRGGSVPVPEAYWMTILPRVRERIEERHLFEMPKFVLQVVSPALAAMFLIAVGAELLPKGTGSSPGDASLLLTSLPESELASLAERHESEAPLILPADVAENTTPEIEESSMLEEIVDAETGVNLAGYLDPEAVAGTLADADQVQLISMLERP